MDKKIKVFGAALDVIDDPTKILAKCSYINRWVQNRIDPERNFLDPYEGLLKYSKVLQNEKFIKIGKFPVDSWITPKPNIEDYSLLHPLKYQEFVNNGAVRDISLNLTKFVSDNILPDIPLMIGADHSLTGGVLRALSNEFGPENILTIIFDAHFDAIPADLSLNVVKYMQEHQKELNILVPNVLKSIDTEQIQIKNSYSYASFIDYLIQDEIIMPQNLIVYGCQDYPDEEILSIEDKRIREYVDYYLSFEKKGVNLIPALRDEQTMLSNLSDAIKKSKVPYVYISFDVDVGLFKEILAARVMNAIGIEKKQILEAAKVIRNLMRAKNSQLVGLDILEIDTYILGRQLKKSGKKDMTPEVIDEFLNIILDLN
jgi:arginase family enzyme